MAPNTPEFDLLDIVTTLSIMNFSLYGIFLLFSIINWVINQIETPSSISIRSFHFLKNLFYKELLKIQWNYWQVSSKRLNIILKSSHYIHFHISSNFKTPMLTIINLAILRISTNFIDRNLVSFLFSDDH